MSFGLTDNYIVYRPVALRCLAKFLSASRIGAESEQRGKE